MTAPAQVTIHSTAGLDRQQYRIRLRYRVENAASREALVVFEVDGEIDGQPFSDSLSCPVISPSTLPAAPRASCAVTACVHALGRCCAFARSMTRYSTTCVAS